MGCKNWLKFIEDESKPKTKVFSVIPKSSEERVGIIKWYFQWRHYCFFPLVIYDTVYSDRCLIEISEFITKLNKEHKKQLALKT